MRSASTQAPTADLLAQLDADGYLLFRELLSPAAVLGVRAEVLGALDRCGWLAGDPADALPSERARREEADADPDYFVAYEQIQRLQALHELAHDAAIVDVMTRLTGAPVLVHPRKIARIGLPRDPFVVDAHQDHPLIQGTPDVLTAWIPLGACPDELGGLKVAEGSHRYGLRPVEPVPNVGGLRAAGEVCEPWLTTDFEAGDVLVFHSLTVHAAKPNHTDRLRLSVDFRYQAASEPIVEGSLVPHYYPTIPGHDELTQGWTSRGAVGVPGEPNVVASFDPMTGPATPPQPRLVTVR